MKLRWLPNFITSLRILGTVILLFLEPASREFYLVYTATGITDALDGTLARALKATTTLGSKLDSVADLLFYTVMLLRLLPPLWEQLPWWIWPWVGGILCVRLSAYVVAYLRTGGFASLHTIWNKMSGFGVFLLPYFLGSRGLLPWSVVVCVVTSIASGWELYLHLRRKAQ